MQSEVRWLSLCQEHWSKSSEKTWNKYRHNLSKACLAGCNLHSPTALRFCSLASLQAHMAHQDRCIDWPISLSKTFHPRHNAHWSMFIYFILGYRSTKQLDVSCGQGGFVDYFWGWPALVFEINQHGGTPQQCKENCCTPKGPLSKKQTTHCWTIQGNNSHMSVNKIYNIYIYK